MPRKTTKSYYVYILRCKDRTLYCGITNDLIKREQMHNSGKGSAYVRSRGGGKIIYSQKLRNKSSALKREAAIKRLSRTEKLKMIKNTRT